LEGEARKQVLVEGLAAARAVEDAGWRAEALTALAPHLEDEARKQVLAEGLAAARVIENESVRADALAALASHLEGQALKQALAEGLAAARAVEDAGLRADVLVKLALRMLQIRTADATLLKKAWQALAPCIWDCQDRERKDLLQLFARDSAAFLRAFDLPQEAYARIALSIIDICTKWEWL
jgi:hypothetical protein